MEENKIVIYQTEDGQTQIDVRLENETVWLTQAQMAELFEKDQSVVARHLNNAIRDGELEESNMHFFIILNINIAQQKFMTLMLLSLLAIVSRANEVLNFVNGHVRF